MLHPARCKRTPLYQSKILLKIPTVPFLLGHRPGIELPGPLSGLWTSAERDSNYRARNVPALTLSFYSNQNMKTGGNAIIIIGKSSSDNTSRTQI